MIALGVDAGGSETIALRLDDGAVARSGCGNPSSIGVELAADAISLAINELARGERCSVVAGVAGAAGERVARELERRVGERLPPGSTVKVEDDGRIALRAGVPDGAGVVIIAGTGSYAYAESGTRHARVGGAGYLLGDEGSGFAIAIAALRLALRTFEGRADDRELRASVEGTLGARDRAALLSFVYRAPVPVAEIAAFAPAVLELANGGHRGAARIVQTAAGDLSELVRAAAQAAGLAGDTLQVALHGGLLRANSLLTFLLETRLVAELPGVSIVRSADATAAARAAARFAGTLLANA